METTRRKFLQWLGAIVAAPAIVKAAPAKEMIPAGTRIAVDTQTMRVIGAVAKDDDGRYHRLDAMPYLTPQFYLANRASKR